MTGSVSVQSDAAYACTPAHKCRTPASHAAVAEEVFPEVVHHFQSSVAEDPARWGRNIVSQRMNRRCHFSEKG